ncbi:hypothetical protein B0H12DRAFT_96375 [Mycena haematopus]|nr:hypothetical protein B0H12DRAFT_96375 [Mycena haematopus]
MILLGRGGKSKASPAEEHAQEEDPEAYVQDALKKKKPFEDDAAGHHVDSVSYAEGGAVSGCRCSNFSPLSASTSTSPKRVHNATPAGGGRGARGSGASGRWPCARTSAGPSCRIYYARPSALKIVLALCPRVHALPP